MSRTVTAVVLCAAALLPRAVVGAKPLPARPHRDAPATPAAAAPLTWTDLSGNKYGPGNLAKVKATVFLFTSTQCPVAGAYAPRLVRLAQEYGPKGVTFFLVNANIADSRAAFTTWAKERKIPFPLVKDEGTTLADRLGASTTPQGVVVDPAGRIAYIGRVDDNANLEKVTRQDVAEALNDLLAGQPVRRPRTRAFGCAIFRDKAAPKVAAANITYARDVAPILQANCISCHRTGDVAPFALDSYPQAKLWAASIRDYTARRLMPPWKAVPGHGGEFLDARYLTEKQIVTLAAWADAGAPQGDPKQMAAAPKLWPAGGWQLGAPDLVVKPALPYRLEAEGKDVYRDFALPIDFTEDRYISAMDFRPSNRTIVHHMIAYMDLDGGTVAAKEGKDGQPGWDVSGAGSGIKNGDWGAGWAPGMNPRRLPPGVAVRVPKGAKLVLQVHYHKTGRTEQDQSELALYWAKMPIKEVIHTSSVGDVAFHLEPGVAGQVVKGSMDVPFDATLWEILPHMHMLGTDMKVTATLPDGTVKSLIWVKNWDFNWQMNYRYKEPIHLPEGSRVEVVATYDNTASNPNQPSNPPQLVKFGEQTTDEMCFAFLNFSRDTAGTARRMAAPQLLTEVQERRLPGRTAPQTPANLLKDTDWTTYVDSAQGAVGKLEAEKDGSARVEVTKIASAPWGVQYLQRGLTLEKGKRYTLQFRARADMPRSLAVAVQKDVPDYEPVGLLSADVPLGTEWRAYRRSFVAGDNVLADHTAVALSVGQTTGTVWFADFLLVPDDAPPPNPAKVANAAPKLAP